MRRAIARVRLVVAALVTAPAAAWPAAAHAQLRHAAERLAQAWREAGAYVTLDRARFLNDDESLAVVLPPAPDASAGNCVTVALVGARGLGFHVSFGGEPDESAEHVPSEAGALSFERCGDAVPRRIALTADSGRGAIETVIARASHGLKPLREVLPERAGGAPGPGADPGRLLLQAPPARRADVAEARAARDGATIAPRVRWEARGDGTGGGADVLAPGCHVLELLAPDPRAVPGGRGKLDIDSEMRDASGERILARDRSDAPDARLAACVDEETAVQVAFIGAPPRAQVLVSHWAWPLPAHLPKGWGDDAVTRMARALTARHAKPFQRDPTLLLQGGAGVTPLALPIEPGACYVALVVVTQGSARSLTIRARAGSVEALDDRGPEENAAVAAFCAGSSEAARAEVEAHGTPLLGWGLALYRVASGAWEAAR